MSQESITTTQTYERNAMKYVQRTQNVVGNELKRRINHVLQYITPQDTILEVGSGSGKDAEYIESNGYKVQRSDGVHTFVQYLQSLGHDCLFLDLLNNTHNGTYKMIFANAVFLHFTPADLHIILERLKSNLQEHGFLALGVKQGKGSVWSDHKMDELRFFYYRQESDLVDFLHAGGRHVLSVMSEDDKRIRIVARLS